MDNKSYIEALYNAPSTGQDKPFEQVKADMQSPDSDIRKRWNETVETITTAWAGLKMWAEENNVDLDDIVN
jgi:hypothetical protein